MRVYLAKGNSQSTWILWLSTLDKERARDNIVLLLKRLDN